MSGIEIAGIALAVFTVVSNGISHFVQGVKTIKYWRRYRIKLQGYAANMETQRVFYLDTLEGLLDGIVESDKDLAEMMAKPGALGWQSENYDKRLRQRLGRSYDVYLRTVREMYENLDSLCGQLGLSSTGEVLWNEYSIVDREMQRLKITVSKNVHQRLIADIDTANKNIREITRQSSYLEPIRETRRMNDLNRHWNRHLKLIRDHAASLYRVFVSGTNWKCRCKSRHAVSLRLKSHPTLLEEISLTADNRLKFRILLSNILPSKSLPGTLQWQEIETRSSTSMRHPMKSTASLIQMYRDANLNVASSTKTATLTSCQLPDSSISSATAIKNLCNEVWRDTHSSEMMGFLFDEENHEQNHEHYLYRVDTLPVYNSQSRSLHDVLSETRENSPLGTLLKRERLELAIILTSSVLHLEGTWWLNSQWSSHDIHFHRRLGEEPTPLTHPYLSWRQCAVADKSSTSTRKSTIGSGTIRNESLFALGLTLIELCFGKPFSALRRPEDGDLLDEATNKNCAFRLLAFVYDEMDGVYGDVVRRCLFQAFDVRVLNFNIEEVQNRVLEDIVVPLVENLKISKGDSGTR